MHHVVSSCQNLNSSQRALWISGTDLKNLQIICNKLVLYHQVAQISSNCPFIQDWLETWEKKPFSRTPRFHRGVCKYATLGQSTRLMSKTDYRNVTWTSGVSGESHRCPKRTLKQNYLLPVYMLATKQTFWNNVLLTDESKIELFGQTNSVLVS